MKGPKLIENLVSATGLEAEADLRQELHRLATAAGKCADNLTLDELRELLADYLQEVLVEAKNEFSA